MNNAQFEIEDAPSEAVQGGLRQREGQLISLIEALRRVQDSADWGTLKKEIFDGEGTKLAKQVTSEAGKSEVSLPALYRLQGKGEALKRYDLHTLEASLKNELLQIRNTLHGK